MRIPITLSELSVIRSGGRIFVQLMGVFAVLFGLWAATVLIDRSMESVSDPDVLPTGEYLPSLSFPDNVILTHRDGRTLKAMLVTRPSSDEIPLQRTFAGRPFTIDLEELSDESTSLVRRYHLASPAGAGSLQAMIDQFQSHLELPKEGFVFPHLCTLVSTEGIALPVTLLHREDEAHIRFRRMRDRQIFTIPINRLIESDQQLIQQFPVGHVETYSLDSAD